MRWHMAKHILLIALVLSKWLIADTRFQRPSFAEFLSDGRACSEWPVSTVFPDFCAFALYRCILKKYFLKRFQCPGVIIQRNSETQTTTQEAVPLTIILSTEQSVTELPETLTTADTTTTTLPVLLTAIITSAVAKDEVSPELFYPSNAMTAPEETPTPAMPAAEENSGTIMTTTEETPAMTTLEETSAVAVIATEETSVPALTTLEETPAVAMTATEETSAPAIIVTEETSGIAMTATEEISAPAMTTLEETSATAMTATEETSATATTTSREASATALTPSEETSAIAMITTEEISAPALTTLEETSATAMTATEETSAISVNQLIATAQALLEKLTGSMQTSLPERPTVPNVVVTSEPVPELLIDTPPTTIAVPISSLQVSTTTESSFASLASISSTVGTFSSSITVVAPITSTSPPPFISSLTQRPNLSKQKLFAGHLESQVSLVTLNGQLQKAQKDHPPDANQKDLFLRLQDSQVQNLIQKTQGLLAKGKGKQLEATSMQLLKALNIANKQKKARFGIKFRSQKQTSNLIQL